MSLMLRHSLFVLVVSLLFLARFDAAIAGPSLVFDAQSDQILYEEDADQIWHPASLTKLLTAYIAFQELEAGRLTLGDPLLNSARARREPPSKIGLPLGKTIPVELGLRALLIKSANDVAVMFAEKISGSVEQFAVRMNKTAKSLGMNRSHFVNPNGLPDKRQVTTARDMGILARAIIRRYSQYEYLFSLASFKIGKRVLRSHNDMLRTYQGANGMKTGFICASGFNIVVSAQRNKKRLIAVVLGAHSTKKRRARATKLLDRGFSTYWWKLLFPKKLKPSHKGVGALGAATNLRPVVCRPRKRIRRRIKRRYRKAKPAARRKNIKTSSGASKKPTLKKTIK